MENISARITKGDYSQMAWRMKFAHAEDFRRELSFELEELDRVFPPSIQLVAWDGKTLKYQLTSHAPKKLEWSLTLGDCLHNYRSSLDSLYFSIITNLAERHGREINETMENSLQFPIWIDSQKFEMTRGLFKYGTTVLREDLLIHQPFLNFVDVTAIHNQPLEQLRLLSNKDRHRQLNVVQTFLSDYALFHSAGIEVTSGRRITHSATPNKYLFEFDVANGQETDNIEFIPTFTTGVVPVDGTLPQNSVQNLLGLISGQIFDYIERLEYHLDHDLGDLLQ
jgi:hypothetical protein